MTYETKLMCGIILITIPGIQFGGHFLLQLLVGRFTEYEFTPFQKSMFRAGHAHAGVLVILSLVGEILVDHTTLGRSMVWMIRISMPVSVILISGGFFFSAMGRNVTKPNSFLQLVYIGALLLAVAMITLGVGLL